MSGAVAVWLAVLAAVAAWLTTLWRCGSRDILLYVCAYIAFFGLGPAINYLLGNDIYVGIATAKIGTASLGVLLALLGVLSVAIVSPVRRTALDRSGLDESPRVYHLVPILALALAAYALAILVLSGPSLVVGSKLDRVAAAGPWHYQYLGIELLVCSFYFLAARTQAGRAAYWANMVCYVCYCLATAERDFIFVLFGVALHVQLFRPRAMSMRLALMGGAFVIAATYLAALRSGEGGALRGGEGAGVAQALNQGSVMFADTYVMTLVPAVAPFQYGQTYLDAVSGVLPGWLVEGTPTLMTWLADTYAPGGSSGYGFSLTAEAYLNFGLAGIPVVFAALAGIQRVLVSRVDQSQISAYMSVLFTVCWMYAIRGESATLVKTLAYGAALFGMVHLTSFVRDRRTPDRCGERNYETCASL